MNQPYVALNNSALMPQIGLGVWQTKEGGEVETAVSAALSAGYRLIDTAAVYGNERGVGNAIAMSGIPREDIFVTTKVWNADQGYDETLAAFDKSKERLGLDYIDLYLIHWPAPKIGKYIDTWRALEKLYADGRVGAIGVSNFTPDHLEELADRTAVTPAVNQIEVHPRFTQVETRNYCKGRGIAVESYSPLGSGSDLLGDPLLASIGEKYGKSAAQVVIRWHIQNDLIVIPKSTHPERIAENINVLDFKLTPEEMQLIDDMDTGKRVGSDPTKANFT